MATNRKSGSKMRLLSLVSAGIIGFMAFACVIKDDSGRDRTIVPDGPNVACDAKCGCFSDGHATEWSYCMAHK